MTSLILTGRPEDEHDRPVRRLREAREIFRRLDPPTLLDIRYDEHGRITSVWMVRHNPATGEGHRRRLSVDLLARLSQFPIVERRVNDVVRQRVAKSTWHSPRRKPAIEILEDYPSDLGVAIFRRVAPPRPMAKPSEAVIRRMEGVMPVGIAVTERLMCHVLGVARLVDANRNVLDIWCVTGRAVDLGGRGSRREFRRLY